MYRSLSGVGGDRVGEALDDGMFVGKRTLTMGMPAAVQRKATAAVAADPAVAAGVAPAAGPDPFDFSFAVERVAAEGTRGAPSALPHLEAIQRSFGSHDVGGIEAHTGADAGAASRAIGAEAYASGNAVAFDGAPSLHTAAHEAAHVVQQRAGVHAKGGLDGEDAGLEHHADQVADRVVAGESAQDLLDQVATPGAAASAAGVHPIMRKLGKWIACGLMALGGVAAVVGGIVTGNIPIAILGGLSILGAIAVGKSAYDDDRRQDTIEQFGNRHRDLDIDPDGDEAQSDFARPDDAPIVPEFRVAFNQLENWKIFIKTRHPDLNDEFRNTFIDGEEGHDFGSEVKDATKAFKTEYRKLGNDPGVVEGHYRGVIEHMRQQILTLTDEITAWYLQRTGHPIDEEAGLLDDDRDRVNGEVKEDGDVLWREQWQESILKVNTKLAALWPGGKARLRAWVEEKREDDETEGVDLTGNIGELEYIGSLAKGVKGPPKQHIRFNPENFDVDANLNAPPLTNYATQVKGKVPDRQRIFGRAAEIPPLVEFADEVHDELIQIPGIVDDDDDKFDIALEAADTPQQVSTNTANEKLYTLRRDRPVDYGQAINQLDEAGLLAGDGLDRKLREDADPHAVSDILDAF